ncbi:MAG: TolC family protein [Bacteroidia bacterium]|nr:TolC family protein [Bacteroidia bacterium]
MPKLVTRSFVLFRFIWVIACCLWTFSVKGQERISMQSAIEEALKSNFSVQISRNKVDIAQNESTIGNAGMLPVVSIGAGENFALNNTQQKLSTGNEINRKGAQSTNTSAGVSLNWTLFDGFKMFITYDKLKATKVLSETELRQQMENVVGKVISSYLEIVKQQEMLRVIDTTLVLLKERMELAKNKWEIGTASKMEFLQTTVDLNEQKSARLNQLLAIENAKTQLNVLLGRKPETALEVETGIQLKKDFVLENLKTDAIQNNSGLTNLRQYRLISELSLKEIRSGYYPKLIGSAGYTYSRSTNQASIIQYNQNLGLTAGLNLSWNVFDGLNLRRKIHTAQLGLNGIKLEMEELQNQTESSIIMAFRKFSYALSVLEMEEANLQVAKESVMVARERFKAGSSTLLELKDVERSFIDANSRLVNAQYLSKLAETELKQISGTLLQ